MNTYTVRRRIEAYYDDTEILEIVAPSLKEAERIALIKSSDEPEMISAMTESREFLKYRPARKIEILNIEKHD